MKKVKSVLISQPKPEGKSPYAAIQKKHNLKIDYFPFMHVEEMTSLEFKEQRISLLNHDSVIFTSKNAMDHYFGMMEKLRLRIPDFTKYFCVSEAVALYLQKHVVYRKRKIFHGRQRFTELMELIKKHKSEKYILPSSDILKDVIPKQLKAAEINYQRVILYKTVVSDLSDLENVFYDCLVFYSPAGIESLFKNFPEFQQKDTRIAVYGETTKKAALNAGLEINIAAPAPNAPSMIGALEAYIKEYN